MRSESYEDALARYARIRRIAYDDVTDRAVRAGVAGASLRLTDLDRTTLDAWARTWVQGRPFGGGWDWKRISRPFRRRPAGFHLALWHGEVLCGLAVGRASAKRAGGVRHTLSLHYIEGAPDPEHPLVGRVALLVITAASLYARELGVSRLRLVDPLPGVLPLYSRLGFNVAASRGQPVYWEKRI